MPALTRRGFLGTLAAIPAAGQVMNQKQKKWYITGGRTENGIRDDVTVPPLVSYGKDRIEALANSGITVWSEDEWADAQKAIESMRAAIRKP